jgi:hypothetical protein
MKTNSKNHPVFQYLINCIPDPQDVKENYGLDKAPETLPERLRIVIDTFKSEFSHEIKRQGQYKAFTEWLTGLPSALDIDFENWKILQLAEKWESIPVNATEKQQDKILENWWNFITIKFFQLCKFNKVEF